MYDEGFNFPTMDSKGFVVHIKLVLSLFWGTITITYCIAQTTPVKTPYSDCFQQRKHVSLYTQAKHEGAGQSAI